MEKYSKTIQAIMNQKTIKLQTKDLQVIKKEKFSKLK
tara:strand:+ start:390 stop:500 length:111 start_codon:yes stop_codon:yes gene_type:complete